MQNKTAKTVRNFFVGTGIAAGLTLAAAPQAGAASVVITVSDDADLPPELAALKAEEPGGGD